MTREPAPPPDPAVTVNIVLVASLLPLAIKAAAYLGLGSHVPALAFALGVALVWTAVASRSQRWRWWAIVTWVCLLFAWGTARLVVFGLNLALGIPEAHITAQLHAGYVALSILHLALGVWLLRHRPRGVRASTTTPG